MSNPNATPGGAANVVSDTGTVTKQQWKWSFLAGMASYLDAGSIVALGVGLSLFAGQFQLQPGAVGAIQAFGPNAIGAAIGAFIGGRLGDLLGRKRIYQYDLLVYAAGILCLGLAINASMMYIGVFIIGLAVGADIPTSLALVGEFAPTKARGKLLAFTQVAWCLGPAVVLWLAIPLASLNHPILAPGATADPKMVYDGNPATPFMNMLGLRIIFFHLFVVAIVTWALRQGLAESARWKSAKSAEKTQVGQLFKGANFRALQWTTTIYLFQNLAGGTAGGFNVYFIETLHAGSPAAATAMYSLAFVTVMLVTWLVVMRFSDRSHAARKWIWGVGSVLQVVSWALFIFMPFTTFTVLFNIIGFAAGSALAGEALYKTFSQELFPTMLRSTAQGVSFGVARFTLGIWSLLVPVLLKDQSIKVLASCLSVFLIISGVVGFFGMPNTSGKSLEQIETERAG